MTAYWIAHVTVTDPVAYAGYQALAPAAFAAHGARFLARGGAAEVLEGPALDRHVVIAFPSMQAARACYGSDEYARARALRDGACTAHVVLVEGLPQDERCHQQHLAVAWATFHDRV
ncbi:MAG: DUF1330 domain-containing protein [Gemmobacter sp.]